MSRKINQGQIGAQTEGQELENGKARHKDSEGDDQWTEKGTRDIHNALKETMAQAGFNPRTGKMRAL